MTHLDDLWPGDMVIIAHRWPFQTADLITSGFVVGDPLTGAAIHRMPMEWRHDECYLRILVPSAEPPKYKLVMTATIRGILLTGRGTAHDDARKELAAYEAQKEYVPRANKLPTDVWFLGGQQG